VFRHDEQEAGERREVAVGRRSERVLDRHGSLDCDSLKSTG
jgi:hypothetical protein